MRHPVVPGSRDHGSLGVIGSNIGRSELMEWSLRSLPSARTFKFSAYHSAARDGIVVRVVRPAGALLAPGHPQYDIANSPRIDARHDAPARWAKINHAKTLHLVIEAGQGGSQTAHDSAVPVRADGAGEYPVNWWSVRREETGNRGLLELRLAAHAGACAHALQESRGSPLYRPEPLLLHRREPRNPGTEAAVSQRDRPQMRAHSGHPH